MGLQLLHEKQPHRFDAVIEAVRKVKPEKVNKDGSPKLSRSDFLELQLRVKNMR